MPAKRRITIDIETTEKANRYDLTIQGDTFAYRTERELRARIEIVVDNALEDLSKTQGGW